MAHVEDRGNNCVCYRNRRKAMMWQADYIGVVALESGDKYRVRIYGQKTRDGTPCVGVKLQLKGDS
jgi:hypothetical protein